MHISLCDDLSVNYSPSDSAGDDQHRSCTTQSLATPVDYPSLDGYYTPSPTLPLAGIDRPPQHLSSHFLVAGNLDSQAYSFPQIHSASYVNGMWPRHPTIENYAYSESARTASCGSSLASYLPKSSNASPRSWPSPEVQQLNLQQTFWNHHESLPAHHVHTRLNLPNESRFTQPAMTSYSKPGFPDTIPSLDSNIPTDLPEMTPDAADYSMSDRSASPTLRENPMTDYLSGGEASAPQLDQGEHATEGEDATKTDEEPYAKLIYKAFMSREIHAMNLQDIYQWFRDNTDKAKSENKGWQNSIRHNLSMNAAFVKRDKKRAHESSVADAGDPKKSTEWVLENWAVQDGVQSTTRYRNNNCRGGARSRSTQQSHLSARASSGRKGSISASLPKSRGSGR